MRHRKVNERKPVAPKVSKRRKQSPFPMRRATRFWVADGGCWARAYTKEDEARWREPRHRGRRIVLPKPRLLWKARPTLG